MADSKVIIDHLRDEAQFSPDETTKAFLLNRADEIEQELELRMVDFQMLIQSAKNKEPYRLLACLFVAFSSNCKHFASTKPRNLRFIRLLGFINIIRTQ
ncbi:hypothetical protein [uncultured Phascolarctobacterium sp.]|uniref:hypothetical protein n=1 Tax=uncultured Phascolarctobacterium sp. TaxID=512296 RepID=UPI00261A2B90|nr:hypothetical protein [uncultured Phascolarctobacterium sp.]